MLWRRSWRGGWELDSDGSIFFVLFDPTSGRLVATEIWDESDRKLHQVGSDSYLRFFEKDGKLCELPMKKAERAAFRKAMTTALAQHPESAISQLAALYKD